jgi:hypothetical protein
MSAYRVVDTYVVIDGALHGIGGIVLPDPDPDPDPFFPFPDNDLFPNSPLAKLRV